MTTNEAAAVELAKATVQSAENALRNARLAQRVRTLQAGINRLDLRLTHARVGRLLQASDDRDRDRVVAGRRR